MTTKYNVTIIGAGSAGVEAAKLAAKNKLKTVLIEEAQVGGVCLNRGCIPTKFYLNHFKGQKDFNSLYGSKNDLISNIRSSLISYLKSLGVDIITSRARIKDKNTVQTEKTDIDTDYIIIATGSRPVLLNGLKADNIIMPEDFLDSGSIYDRYLIVGAGAIGVEFSFLLSSMGKDVTLIEKEPRILPFLDEEISRRAERLLKKVKIDIRTSQDVYDYDLKDFDQVILSVGREPNLEDLGLEDSGVLQNENRRLIADSYLRTSHPNIYVCGDAQADFFYAYTAEYQARICVQNILNKEFIPDYKGMPASIFMKPSVSSCGLTEQDAEQKNLKYHISKFTFNSLSSSFVYDDNQGFAKLILDDKGYLLGAHLISNLSHEIIGYFSLCIRNNWKKDVLERLILIHPTISEFITKI